MDEEEPLAARGTSRLATGNEDGNLRHLPQVAKGAMINFAGAVVRMVLVYAYTLLLTRVLSVDEVGQFFIMVTVVNILGAAAVVGLDHGMVRFVALFAGEGRGRQVMKVFRMGLMLGVLFGIAAAVILFFFSGILADLFFKQSQTAVTGLRIFAIAIPFWVAARLFNATTQGMHRMRYQVYSRDFAEQISRIVLTITVVAMGAGLIGVVWANVASLMLAAFMSFFFAMFVLPWGRKAGTSPQWATRRLLKYSLPLAFSNVLTMVVLWVDLMLVGYLGTTSDAGLYAAAIKVAVVGTAILVAFATVFNPIISDLHNRHQRAELESLFKTITRWIFTFSLPVFLVLIFFPDSIMRMFGAAYVGGGTALSILALSQLVTASIGSAGLLVLMTGHSRIELLNMATALAIDLIMCFLLIPEYGIVGAAIANLGAALSLNLMRSAEVWIFLRMHAFDRAYWKPVIAGAICSVIVSLSNHLLIYDIGLVEFAAQIAGLLLVYFLALFLFGLNEQDKDVLNLIRGRITRMEN